MKFYDREKEIREPLQCIEFQRHFNKAFYEKKEAMLRVLRAASSIKYRLEATLFLLFPFHYVGIYKLMKKLG